jgi:hypothetical protein
MKKLIIPILFLLCGWASGQVSQPPGVILVSSAPSGACNAGIPGELLTTTGTLYSCQSGTWATISGGGGSGTVTTVSVVTANGVSGSVANPTTTPAITLTLGAITPTSTNGVSAATMAFVDATSSIQTQLNAKGTGSVTSIATTGPLGGGTITTSGTLTCTTCVVASSPGVGIAHFAGSTQTVTSSAVSLSADVTGQLPIGAVGSAGLSGTTPIAISATGAISATLSSINPQTATYQVLAADFSSYKTITVASGTFTITLVASGTQPAAGQYISVLNYGSGVVTIARSGQNINGAAANFTLNAGSASAPTSTQIFSDGTNYFASVDEATVGTVTSVAQTVPSGFAIAGSPITTSGTLAITYSVAATGQIINSTGSNAAGFTATPTLGASGTLGSLTFGNATSGLVTLQTATGAITSYTIDLPVAQPTSGNTFLSCTAASPAICTWVAGGGGSTALSSITLATGANTLANGNNPQTWNWAQTTGSQAAMTFGETTAASGSSDVELQVSTLTTTTAIPLQITQGAAGPAAANAPAIINISAAAAGGAASASINGLTGAPITLLTGAGSAGGATTGNGGTGGAFSLTTGAGGAHGGTTTNTGGAGGAISLTMGAGTQGAATGAGGPAGALTYTGGTGGAGGATSGTGGAGSDFNVTTGTGGAATAGSTTGRGGNVVFTLGSAGGTGTAGAPGQFEIVGGTVGAANTTPFLNLTGTWNTTGVVDAAIFANITNTASGTASKLMDLQIGSTTQFNVDKVGNVNAVGAFISNGTSAGFIDLPQGTSAAAVAPCNAATSICIESPTSVTSQLRILAGAPATGFSLWTNSSGTMTETIVGTQGTIDSGVGTFGSLAVNTVIAQGIAAYAGHFTNLVATSAVGGGTCTTAPTFNVFDGTSNTGTAKLSTTTTQTKGTATSQAQTLTFAAGDLIGIYISTAGATCTTDTWTVSAQYSTP